MSLETMIPDFVCPRCHTAVEHRGEAYHCAGCAATYPVVHGVADFRVLPDPWISIEDDRAKADRLATLVRDQGFADAVRMYWQITPGTPRSLAERFTRSVLEAESRATQWLDRLDATETTPSGPWLDIGCGTGDMLAAGRARGATVIGVDVALRWLIVASRRPSPSLGSSILVCANAEHLPFPPNEFARVLSTATIEHCGSAGKALAEARRVLRRGGTMHVKTVNRYSLLPEPHVGVWGVGLLPRRWADRFVRWRTGQRYLHHRPLSPRELSRDLRRAGFLPVSVEPAPLLDADRDRLHELFGTRAAWAAAVYERLRSRPVSRAIMRWVSPLLEARGVAA